MKLYIVLQISQLKKLNKIAAFLLFLLPFIFYGQNTDSVKINYNFIDSYPQNANVLIDDELIGNTPLFFVWQDSLFPKRLTVSLKGFTDESTAINDNQLLNKKFILVPAGKRSIQNLVKENKQTYFKEPRKVASIVISSLLTTGSGFAAFYFKSLASDNRKEYEEFGDQSSLDRKEKYDLLGGVSLVAFQLGFGALIYFLFLD